MLGGAATLAGVAAIAAAGCYGGGIVVQHHQARDSTAAGRASLAALVGLVHDGRWLSGVVLMLAGGVLHVLALALGPVSLVQPLQVTALLFALPLGARWDRRRLRRGELAAALAVVVGVAAFLGAAVPGGSRRAPGAFVVLLTAAVVALVALAAAVLVRRARPALRAAALGAVAGSAQAVAAVLLGSLAFERDRHGWEYLVDALPLFTVLVLLVVEAGAILASQVAFQVGELAAALPAMLIVDPIVSVALGALLLGEPLRAAPISALGIVAGCVLMSGGVVRLAGAPVLGRPLD